MNKNEERHTKEGWNYKKINKVINTVHNIFLKERLTFVEESVILNWFQCELHYNIGKVAGRDYFQELRNLFEKPASSEGAPYT